MGPLADSKQPQPAAEDEIARLLAAASAGDQTAWREIVNRYSRRVFALAKSRCRRTDLAEEVTQSVFATVAVKLGSGGYAERGRFESWLFRVAMNRVRDEMRRLKRHADPTDPTTLGGVTAPTAVESDLEPQMLTRLRLAMASLPDMDREIIELRHHGQMSFREIADMLSEPLGTLLARHHRALRKLKQLMGDDEKAGES